MVRRRSVVWGYFSTVNSVSVQCLLCRCLVPKHAKGTTTALLRHLRVKHPTEVVSKIKTRLSGSTFAHGNREIKMETDSSQFYSVEVALEEEETDNLTMGNEAEVDSAISVILEAGQEEQMTNEEAISDLAVSRRRGKRSLIWRHFDFLESSSAAQCHICMKILQCCEGGSTSNLHRHMSKRHPGVFSQLLGNGQNPQTSYSTQGSNSAENTSAPPETVGLTEKRHFPDVSVVDGDSDSVNTGIDAEVNSTIDGILKAAQGPAEQITCLESSCDPPTTRRRSQRSAIWRHFERLENLDAAQCRICMKKLQCFEGGSTSNLHRHMSKRHPGMFSQLWPDAQNQSVNGDTSTPPAIVKTAKKRQCSGMLKFSRASEGQVRVLRRERELIEALRRVQREEAQALGQQRELIEKLRAANAREAAAEKEQIESLRKAQMEEAKDLCRQREELQKEKAEFQKKWEELQQQS